MDKTTSELGLPGFRFHPTEEELLDFYLRKMVLGKKQCLSIIGFLNIYHHEPWDLPGLSKVGEREWYFFVPRDRKNGHGGRPNRTTEKGFWKATGSDRLIRCLRDPKKILGLRKTLVFYKGRAPRGSKTDWIMNEYRLPNTSSSLKEDIVLCKIYRKATSLKVMEQRAAMEEESRMSHLTHSYSSPPIQESFSSHDTHQNFGSAMPPHDIVLKAEEEEEVVLTEEEQENRTACSSLGVATAKENLTELQLPKLHMDWTSDPLWTLLRSPLLDNSSPYPMW
ncbi:hypothetical protein AAG906_015707 [Vitis piasezkii]